MSVDFLESFDNYTTFTTGQLGKWQTINNNGNVLGFHPTGGRNGTQSLSAQASGAINAPGGYFQRGYATTTREIIGIAVKVSVFDVAGTCYPLQWLDGTTPQVSLAIGPTGLVSLIRGATNSGVILATSASPVIAATGVYYYLELDVTFNNGAGAFTLRSNGVQVFTAAAQNTAPSGANQMTTLRLGTINNNPAGFTNFTQVDFDDIYTINPNVGARNLAFLGDTRVFASFPNADGGTLQLTPSPNQAHYLNVREVEQDGDATYNFDANALDIDLYQHTPTPASTGTVFAVQLCQVSRKDDAAARSTSNYLKSVASTVQGAVDPLSQSYAWYLDVIEVDPATTNPFTKAGIDAAQIGVIVAA